MTNPVIAEVTRGDIIERRHRGAYAVVDRAGHVVAAEGGIAAAVYPRSAIETPTPHFPAALGASELWGRWCYSDRADFERATAAELERALALAGCAPL